MTNGEVWRRVSYWVGFTVLYGGVIPLALVYPFAYVRHGSWVSFTSAFGGGEGLIVAIAWAAGGYGEMRDTPACREAVKSFLGWMNVVFVSCAMALYGFIASGLEVSSLSTAIVSVGFLAVGAVFSVACVAVGTEK